MNIMDLFRPAQPQPVTPAAPATPQNPDPAAFQGTPQSPTVNAQTIASPLDDFKDLLKVDTTTESTLPGVTLDIPKLQEAVAAMDFGIKISPEDAQKLSQGDMSAFEALLNKTAQVGFLRSAIASSQVSEKLTHGAIAHMSSAVPAAVRNQGIQQEIAKNPTFSHEAANPFVQQLATLIAQNNPKATPVEVAEQTSTYLQLLANGSAKPAPAGQEAQNWNDFFRT